MEFNIIKRLYGGDYCYCFNLNPDADKYTDANLGKLLGYLEKQGHGYWLVKCLSEKGFLHFHGMLKIVNIKSSIEKTKKAIHKQINLYIGRAVPLERPDSLVAWYRYIHMPNNIFVNEHMHPAKSFNDSSSDEIANYTPISAHEQNLLDYVSE